MRERYKRKLRKGGDYILDTKKDIVLNNVEVCKLLNDFEKFIIDCKLPNNYYNKKVE